MRNFRNFVAATAGLFLAVLVPVIAGSATVYDFTVQDIDGNQVELSKFKGKVLLIVNTASRCGYTPQYEGLQQLYSNYKDKGLVVLGFPANNFKGQEPGTDQEIKEFCTARYNVSFPMFSKISVAGADKHPLYELLTNKEKNPQFGGEITWNFNKFLIGKDGEVLARFESKDDPAGAEIRTAVDHAIGQ